MWFDSHCHLHLCDPVEEMVARARAAGVAGMVAIGIDVESSKRSVDIARDQDLHAAVGVHPNSALEWDEGAAAAIERLLEDEHAVAVGETGLDFYRDRCPRDVQTRAFEDHIGLARLRGAPLVIHTRASVTAALDLLERVGPPERLVFHCWSGDEQELRRALDLGAYISFAGNVSFSSAGNLRAVASRVPAHRLLVETDTPFLAPVPHRGRDNEPAYVADVGHSLAAARGESAEELATSTASNARELFGL